MTIDNIIKSVRLCIDEEKQNPANLVNAAAYDYPYMPSDTEMVDNIIKDKIGDAIRWICLYAPAHILGGTDETTKDEYGHEIPLSSGILVDVAAALPSFIWGTDGGTLTMPADFMRLVRVRVKGWHRAVKVLLSEDSDEYLQLRDTNGAKATEDRPQAALIEKAVKEIEVWPAGEADYTYVANINTDEIIQTVGGEGSEKEVVALPPLAKTGFIYYLAYLLLSAYGDSRSERMYAIAMQSLKITTEQ